MVDREKVIKGLECHAEVNCVECPYRDGWRTCPFGETLLADALALLKEQSEIVLCKDCKYGEHMCKPWSDIICNQNRATHIPDWFCADGKRKEI